MLEFFYFADEGAAHDDAIGKGRDLTGIVGCGNAESHGYGLLGFLFERAHVAFNGICILQLCPGDPGNRHIINESAGAFDHFGFSRRSARRREKKDQARAFRRGGLLQRAGFFRRHVRNNDSIHSGLNRFITEFLFSHCHNGVVIGHQDKRHLGFGPQGSNGPQNAA